MVDTTQIKEHAEVVGSDGEHVGTVDHVDGQNQIKLARRDPESGGEHHYISVDLVDSAEGDRVQLNVTAQEAKAQWSGGGQSNSASM
jgi:hypothetical protein